MSGFDSEMFQQNPGMPRVLGGDKIDIAQNFECAQRDVAQVPDRRGDDGKASLIFVSKFTLQLSGCLKEDCSGPAQRSETNQWEEGILL